MSLPWCERRARASAHLQSHAVAGAAVDLNLHRRLSHALAQRGEELHLQTHRRAALTSSLLARGTVRERQEAWTCEIVPIQVPMKVKQCTYRVECFSGQATDEVQLFPATAPEPVGLQHLRLINQECVFFWYLQAFLYGFTYIRS